jgi:hypothetical protein
MPDKILATIWMLLLIVFMGILAGYVNEVALRIIIIVLVTGVADFVIANRSSGA